MPHFLLLFSVIIALFISAQPARAGVSTQQYDVKTLSLKEGLAQASVKGIAQDQQGLIWLGTEAGVQTFDGLHLKRLDQLIDGEVDSRISNFRVTQILVADNGNILIATFHNGLFSFDISSRQIQQFNPDGYAAKLTDTTPFYEICQDRQQQIWAATQKGLLQLDPVKGSWQVILATAGNDMYTDVACVDNEIITHHDSELVRYDKRSQKTSVLPIKGNTVNYDSMVIKQVNSQYTLIGTHDGLFRLSADFSRLVKLWPKQSNGDMLTSPADHSSSASTSSSLTSPSTLSPAAKALIDKSLAQVNDVLLLNNSAVWLATEHFGLVLVELSTGRELRRVQHMSGGEYSLSGNTIKRLMQDQSKLLWVSIDGIGVDRLVMEELAMQTYYSHDDDALTSNDVTAIARGSASTLWLVTNRAGIKRLSLPDKSDESFTQQAIRTFQQYVPDKIPYISDIAEDSLKRLWFTTDQGIVRMNLTDSRSRFYPKTVNNPHGPTTGGRDIFITREGTLYVSDIGAILRYDPQQDTFIRLPMNDSQLPDTKDRLRSIRQHRNGALYVLGPQNIYHLTEDNLLSPVLDITQLKQTFNGHMGAFEITNEGNFYLAAFGALIKVDMSQPLTPKLTSYTGKQLPYSYFYAIEIDYSGNLWLSTNNGLVHFNVKTHDYQHFGLSDGVLIREFNSLANYQLGNGHLLFGGIDGWTEIDPKKPLVSNNSPAIVLSSHQIGSQDSQQSLPINGIHLQPSDHWLQLSFSAMDYRSPQENQYAFFLKGFDPDWRSYGNKSTISFTGLPAGKYTLHAKAATKRGDWHQQVLTIPITIHAPFYRTGLAYTSYTLAGILLIAVILWRRYTLSKERAHYVRLIESSEERMKLALWGSNNSLWDWHIGDNEIFRTTIHFLGYQEEKIATTIETFKALIHPDDLDLFTQELEEVLMDHTAEYSAQYRLKDNNGRWHWISDQGKVVERDPHHKPTRLSGTIRDISLLKQHEEELELLNRELEDKIALRTQEFADQNAQLSATLGTLKNAQKQLVEAEKNASLGNLVAGISHEINTPVGVALTAASHSSDTIKQLQGLFYDRNLTVSNMKKGLQQLFESNELVESAINRTAHLIQTFKQLAVDHNQHEWRLIELPIYLIEILPTFNSLLAGNDHKLTVIDNDFFDIECAPGDLYQIVSQLVSNSLSHAFADTSAGTIVIETFAKEDHWVLRYCDDGCGMDSEVLGHVFDPFYTTKRGEGFAGLGLHLVYNIVNQSLGGTIECFSEEGQGLTFILKFPLRKPV
ncbi:MAG: PAS domain S-box-containing protein [Phenylobacterium sp.]|jgi:PAS domain S-box-containing protein